MKRFFSLAFSLILTPAAFAQTPPSPDTTVDCEILVVGGGLSGVATAYEGLLAGRTVCLTETTDWVGGQISSQGTSALDERPTQREKLHYPRGYLELRDRVRQTYGELNPGDCWVSVSCFLPEDGHEILLKMLEDAADEGNGTLKLFFATVPKAIETSADGRIITSLTAIQHTPKVGNLNDYTLSQKIPDAYQYEDSDLFAKDIIQFVPQGDNWLVVEATETGEVIAIADVPYRLGIDPVSYLDPSASGQINDPYCTQGFTYTFAMEALESAIPHDKPPFYDEYMPYYSYELERLADFDLVFTYRRIWSPTTGEATKFRGIGFTEPTPGDISMQNWTWGNDYRPGTFLDNLILTPDQLAETGQLAPGGWLGGLRPEALAKGEQQALGYFYWLVEGTTDSQLGGEFKQPQPNHRYLAGLDSPMGTTHGLSKYPYMREGRRIIGRPTYGYPDGFTISEVDISRQNFRQDYYQNNLDEATYSDLWTALSGRDAFKVVMGEIPIEEVENRSRATIYPDTVGIGHYAIDFHPCLTFNPPTAAGNIERPGERQGAGQAYPFQIPLRSMIPQDIDNLLVAGKSIATSHIASAAYRVHSFEWSAGAAAGITADFALDTGILPYELVDETLSTEKELQVLRRRIEATANPTTFPGTSIFNEDWEDWR
jgi:hypothetical protein